MGPGPSPARTRYSDCHCSGKGRGQLSLCLLSYFPVTISLEKHGELTAFSRCSNYPPEATCGKYTAHEHNLHSNHTNWTTLTYFQGRENWAQENKQTKENMRLNILSSKDFQSENIIDYTSMKKKEEFERYQDCSWFQKKSSKEDLTSSKLSQAEALVFSDFELNDLDLEMHFGNRDIPPWGDEYLEVFDEEDFHYDLGDKFGEKENYINPSNYNSSLINFKLKEDGISDINSYDCTLKKTDSYDNMKVITSTNLSDIIPISYQEQVNNITYNLQPFKKIKNEIKEESEPYSSGSDQYVLDPDDCDLNIGREETIEVEICSDGQDINDEKQENKITMPTEQFGSLDFKLVEESSLDADMKDKGEDSKCGTYTNSMNVCNKEVPSKEMEGNDLSEIPRRSQYKKADLKLELNKNSFDNPVVNLPTPELDFMDLVHYINNEMLPDAVASPTTYFSRPSVSNDDKTLEKSPPNNKVTAAPTKQLLPQEPESLATSQNFRKPPAPKTVITDSNDIRTINSKDIVDSMSIAERIKTGSTRKRSSKISITSEHLENYDEASDKSDNGYSDDDYGFIPRKRKCRSKSRNSESTSSSNVGEFRFERDSYRERRDKNNEASRRSRQNKKDKERLMYKSREEAERKNAVLRAKADKLEKLVTYLRQLLLQVVLKKATDT